MKSLLVAFTLVIVALAPVVVFADEIAKFADGFESVKQTANEGHAQPIQSADEHNGLTLRVNGILADSSATVISYVVEGREDEGGFIATMGRPTLVTVEGSETGVLRGRKDSDNQRAGVWIFPAIPSQEGDLMVKVDGFRIVETVDGREVASVEVDGQWRAQFAWNGAHADLGGEIPFDSSSRSVEAGAIQLTAARHGVTGTVVSGRLIGFTREAVQELGCPATVAVTASGSSVSMDSCHVGFGEQNDLFEITFPRLSEDFEIVLAPDTTILVEAGG